MRMLQGFAVDFVLGDFGQLVHERLHSDPLGDQLAQRLLHHSNAPINPSINQFNNQSVDCIYSQVHYSNLLHSSPLINEVTCSFIDFSGLVTARVCLNLGRYFVRVGSNQINGKPRLLIGIFCLFVVDRFVKRDQVCIFKSHLKKKKRNHPIGFQKEFQNEFQQSFRNLKESQRNIQSFAFFYPINSAPMKSGKIRRKKRKREL